MTLPTLSPSSSVLALKGDVPPGSLGPWVDSRRAHGPLPGCHSPAGGAGSLGPAAGWGSAVHSSASRPTIAGSDLKEQKAVQAAYLA